MKTKLLSFVLGFAVLAGCGGGGDGENTATPNVASIAPVVLINAAPMGNAGADQTVLVGTTVNVDAGASSDVNGDTLTYKWTLSTRPAKSVASLNNGTIIRPGFVADVAGTYIVSLIVNDGKVDGVPSTATIIASASLGTTNAVPVASAGTYQTVTVGKTVTLDGSASADKNGDSLKYTWTLVSKPAASLAVLTSNSTTKPLLPLDVVGLYSVALIVNDGKTDSLPSTVLISAVSAPSSANAAPLANAGSDQTVTIGTTANLDGTLSLDPNADALTYLWSITTKPVSSTAQIIGPTVAKPQFVPDIAGTYEVSLAVSDGKLSSAVIDRISIVAMAQSQSAAVIPDTGIYRCSGLSKERAALLYSQGHTYLDRDHDGLPCEANDIINEITSPYIAPTAPSSGLCHVSGYYRKNGTYVKPYTRRC